MEENQQSNPKPACIHVQNNYNCQQNYGTVFLYPFGMPESLSTLNAYANTPPESWSGADSTDKSVGTPAAKRGPHPSQLFAEESVCALQAERVLSFLKMHNLSSNEVDASPSNSVNQIIICFYLCWKQQGLLHHSAGGTAMMRFVKDLGLNTNTVEDIALSNLYGRMIKSKTDLGDWKGSVREYYAQ